MNKPSQFSFNKSSLISLQAELARKKEEAVNVTKIVNQGSTKLQIKPHIQQDINPKKETRKEATKFDEPEEPVESSLAIENKVKESLLVKTKLYEQLRNKELVCEDDDRFLVNFNQENNDETSKDENQAYDSDPDSEWVTFVDALGRSRTCLRTDMDYYKKMDSKLKVEESNEEPQMQEKLATPVSDEVLLWDKRKEHLRKMWEEEEMKLSKKANIHYQDVLFNEARTHGVGYYSFSQDENVRAGQQEELKKLREETEKNQRIALGVKDRRNQLMKQRIAAAKRRKRIQMGLPPDDDEEEEESRVPDDEDPNPKEKLKQKESGPLEQKVDEFLNVMKRSAHVRPWDIGKDGVQAPVMSQHEWNEKQRAKRETEFAPPSMYTVASRVEESNSTHIPCKKYKSQKLCDIPQKTSINFEYDVENENQFFSKKTSNIRAEIPPPLFYDKVSDKKPNKCNIEASIEAGLNYLKNLQSKKSKNLDDRIRQDYI